LRVSLAESGRCAAVLALVAWSASLLYRRLLDVFIDQILLIQLNPAILLLQRLHRSDRREKD
jgi:hypothetical protein